MGLEALREPFFPGRSGDFLRKPFAPDESGRKIGESIEMRKKRS
jgi:hypothetical protein